MEKLLIAGNWKMNLMLNEAEELVNSIEVKNNVDVLVAPVYTQLYNLRNLTNQKNILLAAQDCSENISGAYTGDISSDMIKDTGAEYCIVGHSERRTIHNETSELVAAKVQALYDSGLTPIICIGETKDERLSNVTEDVLAKQILPLLDATVGKNIILAYEPVWAIGTGLVPELDQIRNTHAFIKSFVEDHLKCNGSRVLYGGSLKPENANDILSIDNVDGGLIGGASLISVSFNKIIEIASELTV